MCAKHRGSDRQVVCLGFMIYPRGRMWSVSDRSLCCSCLYIHPYLESDPNWLICFMMFYVLFTNKHGWKFLIVFFNHWRLVQVFVSFRSYILILDITLCNLSKADFQAAMISSNVVSSRTLHPGKLTPNLQIIHLKRKIKWTKTSMTFWVVLAVNCSRGVILKTLQALESRIPASKKPSWRSCQLLSHEVFCSERTYRCPPDRCVGRWNAWFKHLYGFVYPILFFLFPQLFNNMYVSKYNYTVYIYIYKYIHVLIFE